MVDWLEELKIQRSKQKRHDHYQQYQTHLEEMDKLEGAEKREAIGEMLGKKFKKISGNLPFVIFNRILK
jgi:hypothetical protein